MGKLVIVRDWSIRFVKFCLTMGRGAGSFIRMVLKKEIVILGEVGVLEGGK